MEVSLFHCPNHRGVLFRSVLTIEASFVYAKGAIINVFLLWLLGQPVWVCRYFETFDVVSVVATEERLKMAGMLAQCSSQEERGKEEGKGGMEGWRGGEMEGGRDGGGEMEGGRDGGGEMEGGRESGRKRWREGRWREGGREMEF